MESVTDTATLYTPDFRVGNWWARPTLNRLELGDKTIKVEPKSMEVLVDLAQHPGEVRSKRRLLHVVWAGAFVGDDVLTRAIWQLRKAFGDDPKSPEYIRTIPRKGYMLVARVVWPRADDAPDERFPYRLGAKLGAGAMGEVYKAQDTRLKRTVALKFLPRELAADQAAKDRFLREARAAAALDHPHIGVVHDVGESPDGRMYIAMAFYRGQSLKERLAEEQLPATEAIDLARQIAEGLAAAHARHIVHRDIKPANVMLTEGDPTGQQQAKIVDFGLARGAGDTTLTTLGSTVGTALYMSPEQARGDEIDPRSDLWSLGVTLYEMLSGERPFRGGDIQAVLYAVLNEEPIALSTVASGLPPGLEAVIDLCLEKDPDARYQEASSLAEDLAALLAGRRPLAGLTEETSPYPGLEPFTEETASFFFGRDQEVQALWAKIRKRKLLALIGPSGAGKTSFVRAGLVPAKPDGWRCLVAKPGSAPFIALAQALASEFAGEPEALRELLRFSEPDRAVAILSRWRHRFDEALLAVDQFEELFTLNPQEAQASFTALLGRLAGDADLHVLLSLRDDFLIHCHEHPPLAPVFEDLTPLTAPRGPALRQAITEPADALGYAFEDDSLVDEMVAEVEEERGALPLVAFTAARLWERRDRDKALLTRHAYDEMDGVAGALSQHAEATLERIGEDRIPIVREIFRNLVTAQGTRAARDREELLSVFEDGEPAKEVLSTLVDARLLTSYEVPATDEDETARHRIEIVHESLLSNWPRLVRWQTQDQEGAQLRDDLRQAAQMWEQHSRADDYLWTGTAYEEFQLWRQRFTGGLSTAEESFGKAMTRQAARRTRRRRWAIAATLLVAAVVTLATGALWRQSEASRAAAVSEARRAEAQKLLALAQVQRDEDPTEALAYTTASLRLHDTEEARVLALRLLRDAPPALELDPGGTQHRDPRFSPDGRWLAVAGHSDDARVFSAEGGEPVVLSGHEQSPRGTNLARWAPGDLLVTGLCCGNAKQISIWQLPAGDRLRTIALGASAWWEVRRERLFAWIALPRSEMGHEIFRLVSLRLPNGALEEIEIIDWTALGADFGKVDLDGDGLIYNKGNEVFRRALPAREDLPDRFIGRHDNRVRQYFPQLQPGRFWTQDGVTGEWRLWDLSGSRNAPLRAILRPANVREGAVFFPDPSGRWAISRRRHDPFVNLWSLEAWLEARPLALRRSGSWYAAAWTFHLGGDWFVATTKALSRLTFWHPHAPWPQVVDGYLGFHRPLAFSPDGQWLATSWADNVLRLWPLPGNDSRDVRLLPLPEAQVWLDLAFDPRGRFLFVAGNQDRAYIVPLDGSAPRRLQSFSDNTLLSGVTVSPSGRQVATAFGCFEGPKTLRVWDLKKDELRLFDLPETTSSTKTGCEGGVWSLAFADESTIYTAGDGGVRRWNLETGNHQRVVEGKPDYDTSMSLATTGNTLLVRETSRGENDSGPLRIIDLDAGTDRELLAFRRSGGQERDHAIDPSGTLVASGDGKGTIRVGKLSGGEPHLLVGHEGPVVSVAFSPDGRWLASTGDDNTLRLWPMPDLDAHPLHALPHDELITKLESLTNLRAVEDPESSTGWSIEVGPFPGWEEIPTW